MESWQLPGIELILLRDRFARAGEQRHHELDGLR